MKRIPEKMYETGLYLCIVLLVDDYANRTGFWIAYLFMGVYIFGMLGRE